MYLIQMTRDDTVSDIGVAHSTLELGAIVAAALRHPDNPADAVVCVWESVPLYETEFSQVDDWTPVDCYRLDDSGNVIPAR